MIVNLVESGWEIIYHRAHALLAAQLGGQWNRENCPPRLYETVAAISHHDDLEKEWEGNHLTSAGAPLDFTLETDFQLQKMKEFTNNARYRGRWVALLISMHMSFINEVRRGTLPELDEFLDEQLANQKKWRKELGITKEEADRTYAFFRWCDRLSLILCQRKLPDRERSLEITTWPDGTRYEVMQRQDQTVTVTPWPFEKKEFTVNVEASNLHQLKFDNTQELTEALQTAPIQVLEWTFVK